MCIDMFYIYLFWMELGCEGVRIGRVGGDHGGGESTCRVDGCW